MGIRFKATTIKKKLNTVKTKLNRLTCPEMYPTFV